MTISKGEPPVARKIRSSVYPWKALADIARENPREWFSINVKNRSYASFLTAGKYAAFAEDIDNWEVTTRASEQGGVDLYVRYHP
jgi:hypothetical protein